MKRIGTVCQTTHKGQHGQKHRDENAGKTNKWKAMKVCEISCGRDDEMQKSSIEQNYLKLRLKENNKGRISDDNLETCI